ncbi:MAG: universal stress protein [bacterium]|nr:universal stress protein [bacterium]
MKTKRILAPVDGSELAHFALKEADALTSRSGGELTLMFVHESAAVHLMDDDFPEPAEMTEKLLATAQEIMEKWASSLKTPEANRHIIIELCCSPAEAIVMHAKEQGVIVMATHGHTGLKHVQLGSVTERVVRSAHCAVLVVKPSGNKD